MNCFCWLALLVHSLSDNTRLCIVAVGVKSGNRLLSVVDEDELERLILAHSPKFKAILKRGRE